GEALVMEVLVFVKDDLCDGLEEVGSLQPGKSDGVVPDDKAVTIGGKVVGGDDSVRRRVESVTRAPPHAGVGEIWIFRHTAVHVSELNSIGRGAGIAGRGTISDGGGHFILLGVGV